MAGISVVSPGRAVRTLGGVAELLGAALVTPGAEPADVARRQVEGASIDTRTLRPGEVFVALEGEHVDGHRFVTQALEQGAAAAIVRQSWLESAHPRFSPGWAVLTVKEPQGALQRWAQAHRASRTLPVAAVAGSNGKTTTRALLGALLASRGPAMATEGNLNNHLGVPLTLLRLKPLHWAAAIEMGINHAGELRRLCDIAQPTCGVITNVGKEHLEGFGSLEAVARAENELADYLDAHGGTPVLNADDPALMEINRGRRLRPRTFGIEAQADVRATDVEARGLGGARFRIAGGPEVRLCLSGRHNVMNALAALATAEVMGVPLAEGARVLAEFRGGEHGRLELAELRGVRVIDDTYNANPASLKAAVEVLKATPVEGRRLAALGDMLELGEHAEREHELAGELLGGVDALWVCGRFADAMARGARMAGVPQVETFPDSAALAAAVHDRPREGDLVLVKGSRGMRMERVVEALKERLKRQG